jgi:WhiB family transcriptional regulator, redox-sensing transcriptional regulator
VTAIPVYTMPVGRFLRVVVPEREPHWRDLAACAQTDPDAFFPEKGGSVKAAKAVCAVCLVTAPCLEYALERDERFGIYGGKSERERRQIKRDQHRNTNGRTAA